MTLSNSAKSPIGYRIVGAKLNYQRPADEGYYIQYTRNNTFYYLGADGNESTEPAYWQVVDGNYLHCGDNYIAINNRQMQETLSTALKKNNSNSGCMVTMLILVGIALWNLL